MLDNLLLLAHGEMVFFGPTNQCLTWFEDLGKNCPSHYNPADFFIDTISEESGNGLVFVCSLSLT
jgi:ATP-binding cassette subfamily G (WHITE) protein 1